MPFRDVPVSPALTKQMASSYKPQLRARERKAEGQLTSARKPRGVSSAAAQPSANSDMFDDLTAIKHLVERLGAEQVRKLVGLFE